MCLWTFQKTPRPFKLGSCIDWNVYIKTTPFSCDSIFCILCYRPHVLKPHVPEKTHFVGLSCGCIVAIKWFSKQKTKQELSRKIENNDILEPFLSSLEDWIWITWSFLIYWFCFQEEKKNEKEPWTELWLWFCCEKISSINILMFLKIELYVHTNLNKQKTRGTWVKAGVVFWDPKNRIWFNFGASRITPSFCGPKAYFNRVRLGHGCTVSKQNLEQKIE